MKNKILALILILIIFVSMMPIKAHAESINFVKINSETKGYKMEYYAPEGYPDVFIIREATNKYHLYFLEYAGQYKCSTTGYSSLSSNGVRIRNITSIDEVYEILFLKKYDSYDFDFVQGGGKLDEVNIKNKLYVAMTLESVSFTNVPYHADDAKTSDFKVFPDFYIEWYYNEFGFFPPIAGNEDEDIEFMKGDYYVILSQETIITPGDGVDINTGKHMNYGYVETVDDVLLESDMFYTISDGKKEQNRGMTYVVISSEKPTGDLVGLSLADNSFSDFIIGSIGKLGIWLDGDTRRNNYNIVANMFYNNEEMLNRYYFKSIQDACKFVLYGTAGAKYIHKEIGKTDYGYGYLDCEYNNYDISGHPERKIPEENYPLGRQEVILTQKDVTGEGRKFIYIDMNYYSRVSMVDSEYNLIINNKYTNAIYLEYTQGKEKFDPLDKKIYKVNTSLGVPKTTTFKLYHEELGENDEGTWIVLYSTYGFYEIKPGTIIDGESNSEQIIKVWKDENGNIVVENTASGEAYKNGETDPYKQNENGEWENSKGEIWDKENYTNEILDWQNSLNKYQNNIEEIADVIEDFTIFVNTSNTQIKEVTSLLNAVMISFPSPFRMLLIASVMALVFGRVVKRKGD